MKRVEIEIIKEYVEERNVIYENELKEFIKNKFKYISLSKINYLLMELYDNDILYKLNNGIFKSCKNKKKYEIKIDLPFKVEENLRKINPPIIISVYSSLIFNDFSSLQAFSNLIFIETYDYAINQVLEVLLQSKVKATMSNDLQTFLKYNNEDSLYVIKRINEDSPIVKKRIQSIENKSFITVPKLEKLMIDILVDKYYKVALSSEVKNIYINILSKYQVNLVTLFRYSKKKYCYEKLINLLDDIGYDVETGEII